MERQRLDSSSLESAGYDVAAHILEIAFRSGRIYAYFNVPAYEYVELVEAASAGQYFNQNIKGHYEFRRV